MTKRQKRRSRPWRGGSGSADAKRVAREDRILEGLLVKSLALPPGSVTYFDDGRAAMTHEAAAIYTAIRRICGAFEIGQHRMQAALVRLARRGIV